MSQESNGPPPEGTAGDVAEVERLKRLIAEAKARGEDPSPLVKRVVLSTIAAVRGRLPPTPDDES